MWVSQGLLGLLILLAATDGFPSESLYPKTFLSTATDDLGPLGTRLRAARLPTARETRSGIFWTGSRYNRRGSDAGVRKVKQRADSFYMGSRYGKRSGSSNMDFDSDPCKYTNFRSLFPCSSFR